MTTQFELNDLYSKLIQSTARRLTDNNRETNVEAFSQKDNYGRREKLLLEKFSIKYPYFHCFSSNSGLQLSNSGELFYIPTRIYHLKLYVEISQSRSNFPELGDKCTSMIYQTID